MQYLRNVETSQKSTCWERQTVWKKSLFALIALSTLLFLSIGVSGAPPQILGNEINSQSVICTTPGCVQAASNVMEYLDESIDPCDNFYDFACGNFVKNAQIPPEKTEIDVFSPIGDLVKDQLRTILAEPINPTESKAIHLAKNFFKSCMNQSIIEDRGLKPISDILDAFGGWPVVKGDSWSDETFNWIEMMKKFRASGFGTGIIVKVDIQPDYANSSKYLLEVNSPDLTLDRELLNEGFKEEIVNSYYKFMVEIAFIFGADKTRAEQELKESLEFEIKLANMTLPTKLARNTSRLYNPTTVKKLQETYPYIDWLDFMNAMLPQGIQIDENEAMNNVDPLFFDQLGQVLNSTSKRTIANYVLWRAIYSITNYLTEEIREAELQYDKAAFGIKKRTELGIECVIETNKRLLIATSALYVAKYFNEDSKKYALEIVNNVRSEFVNILQNVNWMDEETRAKAIKKAAKISSHIGYPDELLDNNKVDEYYGHLEMNPDDLLSNSLRVKVFSIDKKFSKLREPINNTDWRTHTVPTIVNAFYHQTEISVWFPAAILQGRVFSADRPRYMNYATIGFAVGHEITHGFDDEGSTYNANGNLENWWNSQTKEQFLKRAQCMIEQYGNYTDPKTNLTVNGFNTQGENIADNGGIKEAYNAYINWVTRNGPDNTLPGLNYNQKQLFWINAGQLWCGVKTSKSYKHFITTDVHTPNEFRVNGFISNMHAFASDFNCPIGSKMNPAHKCEVW